MNEKDYDSIVKIAIVGDSGVGKTQLIERYISNDFCVNAKSTIGVSIYTKIIELNRSHKMKLQMWDTAGQERFRSITPLYFRGVKCVLLCYCICKKETFENIQNWLSTIRKYVENDTHIILVGTKIDLEHLRDVGADSGKSVALSENMSFFETSALAGNNVEELFNFIINKVSRTGHTHTSNLIETTQELSRITLEENTRKKSKKCC